MKIIQLPKGENCRCAGNPSGPGSLILPVARRPLFRVRYDRPDAEARAVPPAGALRWLEENLRQGAVISGVELDGPGDPLAEMEGTLETLRLIRGKYPELELSVTTLGLHGAEAAKELAEAGVARVTLLVNAVEREAAEKLYAWIRPGNKTIPLSQAIPMLLEEQARAVVAFREQGIKVGVRTTVYPGVNDDQVSVIAREMSARGAESMELVPCNHVTDQNESLLGAPEPGVMEQLAVSASRYLATTVQPEKKAHLGADCPSVFGSCKSPVAAALAPTAERPNIGVVSVGGMEVDLHLGQAYQMLIYGPREDGLTCLLGTRPVPEPGGGSGRWEKLAETLVDCFAVLAAGAGESPRRILGEKGVSVLITDGGIEGAIDQLYGGGKKGRCKGQ
ncbi:MAG: radical SAM protein [Proteobacteria bacterium]|nr:radical SAM protein [Pseudomonadota bacterium]MBU1738171.1 radical SAM protein [Pseudomonadota bacterium]